MGQWWHGRPRGHTGSWTILRETRGRSFRKSVSFCTQQGEQEKEEKEKCWGKQAF